MLTTELAAFERLKNRCPSLLSFANERHLLELVLQINSIFYWNMEIRFKLFFLIDSCSSDLAI